MENISIRKANLADAKGIAFVHVQSWIETYSSLMPQELLNKSTIEEREKLWFQILSQPKEKTDYWVAETSEGYIIGFVSTCPGRDSTYPGYGEITGLYLLKAYHGRSIGLSLFRKGLELLKKNDFQSVYLWVLKDNPTEAFYKKMNGKRGIEKIQTMFGFSLIEIFYTWEHLETSLALIDS